MIMFADLLRRQPAGSVRTPSGASASDHARAAALSQPVTAGGSRGVPGRAGGFSTVAIVTPALPVSSISQINQPAPAQHNTRMTAASQRGGRRADPGAFPLAVVEVPV